MYEIIQCGKIRPSISTGHDKTHENRFGNGETDTWKVLSSFVVSIRGSHRNGVVNNLRLNEASTSETSDESKAESSTKIGSNSRVEGDMSESDELEFEFWEEEEFSLDDESEIEKENFSRSITDDQFQKYPRKISVEVDEIIKIYPKKDVNDFVTKFSHRLPP